MFDFAWPWKSLGDYPLEEAVAVVDEENPHHRLAVLDLLPESGSRGLGRLPWNCGREQHRNGGEKRKCRPQTGYEIPHCHHLISASKHRQITAISNSLPVPVASHPARFFPGPDPASSQSKTGRRKGR